MSTGSNCMIMDAIPLQPDNHGRGGSLYPNSTLNSQVARQRPVSRKSSRSGRTPRSETSKACLHSIASVRRSIHVSSCIAHFALIVESAKDIHGTIDLDPGFFIAIQRLACILSQADVSIPPCHECGLLHHNIELGHLSAMHPHETVWDSRCGRKPLNITAGEEASSDGRHRLVVGRYSHSVHRRLALGRRGSAIETKS
ncbi:hypothetical protein BDZ97DRAFT_1849263 [Flammula alnicola]|nr:hypothetical protein BDZ97DRAFT_1849263 [Flammula alnicola]